MKTIWDFAGSTDMWSTSAGGHLMKVVNLTGFTVYIYILIPTLTYMAGWKRYVFTSQTNAVCGIHKNQD
jgi:hypothetical protein